MLSSDKLTKLFALASGQPTQNKPVVKKKQDTSKIKNKLAYYKAAYSDPNTAWLKWVGEAKNSITSETADDIWGYAEQQFPGDPSQARESIRNNVRSGLSSEPVAKEVDLRNAMQSAPSWMQEELAPEMAIASATVANQNSSKAKSIYSMALEKKLRQMNLAELDMDVPAEVHAQEFIALELMNSLDQAKIVNGRLCLLNEKGTIQPAYSMLEQPQIQNILAADSPESNAILEIANTIVVPSIKKAMANSRDMSSIDNKASGGAAIQMLKSGDVSVDNWGSLLGMINGDGIDAGLEGLATRNPHMSQEDELMYGMSIYDKYGGMNGE